MSIEQIASALSGLAKGGAPTPPGAGTANIGAGEGGGFGESLSKVLSSVDESAGDANAAVGRMVEGKGDVHEAMIALQRADFTLQLTVQVRNKLVQAYQEILRMPV